MFFRQLAFMFLFLIAAPAMAQAQSVYVLGFNSIEGDDEVARRLTAAVHSSLAEQGCSVAQGGTALTSMQLAVPEGACATIDISCLDTISTTLQAGALVFGTLHRVFNDSGTEIEAELHYYDRLEHRILGHFTARLSLTASDEELAIVGNRAAVELAHCTHPAAAALDEDEPSHTVLPATAPAEPEPAPTPIPAPAAPPSHDSLDWLGWSFVGLGVAALAADVGIWIRLNDLSHDPDFVAYRSGGVYANPNNLCDGAPGRSADICSEGSTLEVLQYVFLGVSLAAAVAGSVILILPSLSSDHATLTVAGRF